MPKTEKKKANPKKASPKKPVAKKAAGSKKARALSRDEADAMLKSFQRVLRNKELEHPVRLQFASEEGDHCKVWDCRTINGQRVCGWFDC